MVNMARVANWVTGDLQLFFDGAWGEVCSGLFQGPDADVACRQLGFGAGTVGYFGSDMDYEGFPEVALTSVGCNGTEVTLLECGPDLAVDMFDRRQCAGMSVSGLRLACVEEEVDGTVPPRLPLEFNALINYTVLKLCTCPIASPASVHAASDASCPSPTSGICDAADATGTRISAPADWNAVAHR